MKELNEDYKNDMFKKDQEQAWLQQTQALQLEIDRLS